MMAAEKGHVIERGPIQFFSGANRAMLATAWSTRDTCNFRGHPTTSNYFTMYPYKIE